MNERCDERVIRHGRIGLAMSHRSYFVLLLEDDAAHGAARAVSARVHVADLASSFLHSSFLFKYFSLISSRFVLITSLHILIIHINIQM